MLEPMPAEVCRKHMDGFRVAYIHHDSAWTEIGISFRKLLNLLWLRRLRPAGPLMALYHREPKEGSMPPRFEVAVAVNSEMKPGGGLSVRDLPAGEVASMVYDGPPTRYPGTYATLGRWMKHHGYVRAGAIREIYARDLADLPPGIMYAEIQVPIRPRPALTSVEVPGGA